MNKHCLPVLDDRDFVFTGPTGLANYQAAHGDQPASLTFPGPKGTTIRCVDGGENVLFSIDGTLVAAVSEISMLPEQMRGFMVDNYFAVLRAAKEHRSAEVDKALAAFR